VNKGSTSAKSTGSEGPHAGGAAFVTTHWSIVLTAGRDDSTRVRAALAELCQTYLYPLYAYVRQRGYSSHDAQDLTQGFFARLLEKNTLRAVSQGQGKFRSFLLTALNRFLTDEWRKANAQKRGGGHVDGLSRRRAHAGSNSKAMPRLGFSMRH